jgi:hypothetical protein
MQHAEGTYKLRRDNKNMYFMFAVDSVEGSSQPCASKLEYRPPAAEHPDKKDIKSTFDQLFLIIAFLIEDPPKNMLLARLSRGAGRILVQRGLNTNFHNVSTRVIANRAQFQAEKRRYFSAETSEKKDVSVRPDKCSLIDELP